MAAVDALSLRDAESSASSARRWAAGVAFAAAIHGAAYLYLNNAPAPVGFESQAPIELDLLPPPTGAAQMDEAGADASAESSPEATPEQEMIEEIEDVPPDETTPPDDPDVTAEQVPPEELETVEQAPEATEVPPDVTAAPPDVEPVVTLPPPETVVAREEPVEPKPAPKPIVKKVEPKPKPEPRREQPRPQPARETERVERPSQARSAQEAGGRSGVSTNAGAASAAAAATYQQRVQAALNAQLRSTQTTAVGRVLVSFTVTRSGAISNISTSGPAEAASVLGAMLRRASLPPMPPELVGNSKRFKINLNLKGRR